MLCDQKISLVIYDDQKNKIVQYNSFDFDIDQAKDKVKQYSHGKLYENYNNSCYGQLCENQTMSNFKRKDMLSNTEVEDEDINKFLGLETTTTTPTDVSDPLKELMKDAEEQLQQTINIDDFLSLSNTHPKLLCSEQKSFFDEKSTLNDQLERRFTHSKCQTPEVSYNKDEFSPSSLQQSIRDNDIYAFEP